MANILITGCSSGIGLQSAQLLKRYAHTVVATARNEKDVKMLQDLGFEAYKLDVTNENNIKEILEIFIKNHKYINVLFNNAGFGQPGAIEDMSSKVLKEQFETNFFGLHNLTRETLKIMRIQGFGKIIQHSSILGLISLKFRGAYNASKYAIEGLCDTLRIELLKTDIKVITLNTGPVSSNFRQNALKKFQKNIDARNSFFVKEYEDELNIRLQNENDSTIFTISSSEAAKTVLKIVEAQNPKPRYYITKASFILSLLKRILPTSLMDKILSKI